MTENQIVNPSPLGTVARKEDGTFAAGSIPNPTGENGMKGRARFDMRLSHFMEMSDIELEAFIQRAGGMSGLNQRDQLCIELRDASKVGNAAAKVKIFKEIADRTDGPVKQIVEVLGNEDQPLYPQSTKDVAEASAAYKAALNKS